MATSWADLFDRGAAYDGDLERIRSELAAMRAEAEETDDA
jgi:hypothetical protein